MTTAPTYIFLSHSHQDRPFTLELARALEIVGLEVWLDVDDIPDGSTWPREIEKGIRGCAAMIVVMSKAGRESEWVERETLLAMDLKKPLFIALIDDTPLPLQLINRQFTDFRTDHAHGTQELIHALRTLPLAQMPQDPIPALSPQPDEDNFFGYLEQLPGGEQNALIAGDLYRWALGAADKVEFAGKKRPGFHVRVGDTLMLSVWAYPQQPSVQINFAYLRDLPPYDDPQRRLDLLRDLNALLPDDAHLPTRDADKQPTLGLAETFTDAERLEAFKILMERVFAAIRGGSA